MTWLTTVCKKQTREQTLNTNKAKNVVFFVGDGMGITTVTAARILKGQLEGDHGEETDLEWDKFPSVALSKLINASYLLRFSLLCVLSKGKATGFVTTARVTHATPAALYAHSPHRDWECDSDIPQKETDIGCIDIAQQLITLGQDTHVIMGGGRMKMLPREAADPEYPEDSSKAGSRNDGRNLIDEWQAGKDKTNSKYVWNLEQFKDVNPLETDNLLGLFEPSHMQFEGNRMNDVGGEPSLSEMVEKAIEILQKDQDGFFLMVEGGRIDHAHHDGLAYHALHDTIAMDKAVAKAMSMTNEMETLFIVTADHSHVFSIGGSADRDSPILGRGDLGLMNDGLPFTTLSYANGPGGNEELNSFKSTGSRRNLTDTNTEAADFHHPALVQIDSETHGGEDVTIYANGPMSHLFHGVHDQHYIAHVVRYASGLNCHNGAPSTGPNSILALLLFSFVRKFID
ncbi:alkaline phosphatase, tissue-nonspecific isozyme-like [Asterias rubens]|uniref:alkaline phosphatase, tissue-nonspecific isozyme-like n=1 Tax=Asterias rubens TaxID=7604 RepID=UPI001455C931|nr:alkaline phosphatase, tissue-nonspecific isozyme-like [Asterias rubens]